VYRLAHPHVAQLGRDQARRHFGDLDEHPDLSPTPGILVVRFDAPLIFANADAFAEAIEGAVDVAGSAGAQNQIEGND